MKDFLRYEIPIWIGMVISIGLLSWVLGSIENDPTG